MRVFGGVAVGAMMAVSITTRSLIAQTPPETEGPRPLPGGSDADRRLDELERKLDAVTRDNERLRREVEQLREDHEWTESRVEQIQPVTTKVSGYVDVGFFHVTGDGRGIVADVGNRHFPEYADPVTGVPGSWVFMGDPLSTAINSRGDPADVSDSRAVTLNPIDGNGKSTFLVNNVNLALLASSGDFVVHGLIDFLPRSRNVSVPDQSGLGDYVDVKLGYIEYRAPLESMSLVVSAGKVESLLGHEYRAQESPARTTVTPSLICRYTCGRPVGLRATAGLLGDDLQLGVALTNGGHMIEGFPFASETDTNHAKTVAGRVAYRFPVGAGLEVGASGAWGAQDFQENDSVLQRHIGGHAHLEVDGLEVSAEYVRGDAQGEADPALAVPCLLAPCLEYQGAYGLTAYRVNNWLVPYARVDWRDALHRSGASFVYISDALRGTVGVRLEASADVIAKVEYTMNGELGRIPEFPNDIYTSSLVGRF
jgi:hypothetical protein